MPTLPRPALGMMTSNFHSAEARDAYAHHFRAIGISAVAAGVYSMRMTPQKPRMTDIPAILRGTANND